MSSDDEAPENVSLAAGKASVVHAFKEQRASAAAHKKQIKEQRRTASERIEAQAAHVLEDADYLPEDVLIAVSQMKKGQPSLDNAEHLPVGAVSEQTRGGPGKKRRRHLQQSKEGLVAVKVLSTMMMSQPSESAEKFRRSQLHSARLQRSHDMLAAPASKRLGPAAKFV